MLELHYYQTPTLCEGSYCDKLWDYNPHVTVFQNPTPNVTDFQNRTLCCPVFYCVVVLYEVLIMALAWVGHVVLPERPFAA